MSSPQDEKPTIKPPLVGSARWQSCTDTDQSSAYLEYVSRIPAVREIAALSLRLLALKPGDSVLEIGCGTGVFLPALSEVVGPKGEVVGIDHHPAFGEQARDRVRGLTNVRVDIGDAYALPYPAGVFDAAHCERVLMHLDDPTAALREMRRVVRPGGRIVAAEPAWATLDIDHPEHAAVDLLIREANTVRRHPRMGLELNRRMSEVGLIQREVAAVAICCFDHLELVGMGLDLSWAAESLISSGRLSSKLWQRVRDDLTAASRSGAYLAFAGFFVARGYIE